VNEPRILRLAPPDEAELQSTSVHECGHQLVALAFGLNPTMSVAGTGNGVCVHDDGPAESVAAIGWGGVLAEDLTGARISWRTIPDTPLPLTRAALLGWFNQMMREGLHQLSSTDRDGIKRWPVLSACEAAFHILSANLDRLRELSEWLADQSRESVWKNRRLGDAAAATDVERFCHGEIERRRAERQQVDYRKMIKGVEEFVMPPPKIPCGVEEFYFVIVSRLGKRPDREAARLLLDFAQHLRHRGGDADFLHTRFENRNHWLWRARQFAEWEEEVRIGPRTC